MKCLITLILLFPFFIFTQVNSVFNIYVVNDENKPIENATISTSNKLYGVSTNEDGLAVLNLNILKNEQLLIFSHVSYVEKTLALLETMQNDTVRLKEALHEIKEIVIGIYDLTFYINKTLANFEQNYLDNLSAQTYSLQANYSSPITNAQVSFEGVLKNNFTNPKYNSLSFSLAEKFYSPTFEETKDIGPYAIHNKHLFSFINPKHFLERLATLNSFGDLELEFIEKVNDRLFSTLVLHVKINSPTNKGELVLYIKENTFALIQYEMKSTRFDSPTYYKYNTKDEDLKIDLQVKYQRALVIYRPLVSGKWCLQKAQLELNVEILGETNYLATNKTTINCLKLIEDKVELRFYNNDSLIDLKKSLFLN